MAKFLKAKKPKNFSQEKKPRHKAGAILSTKTT